MLGKGMLITVLRDVRRNADSSTRENQRERCFLLESQGRCYPISISPDSGPGTDCLAHCRDSREESQSRYNIVCMSHSDYLPWILKHSGLKTCVKNRYKQQQLHKSTINCKVEHKLLKPKTYIVVIHNLVLHNWSPEFLGV